MTNETDGVILIDEIDLHLHPEWQHRIIAVLQKIFPNIQFIVTTHAPAVISSVGSDNIMILNNYKMIDASYEIYGNDVNSILKDVMGVPDRTPEVAGLFSEFDKALIEGRFDDAEQILDVIDEKRDYHDSMVVADRIKLKVERIRGGKK